MDNEISIKLQITAIAARARGDHAAERRALDVLAIRERTAAEARNGTDESRTDA